MDPITQHIERTRREFLTTTASGLGMAALGGMLTDDGVISSAGAAELGAVNPLAPKNSHFDAKSKACIFIFMAGAPSHLDLFDHHPKHYELSGV